MPLPLAPTFLLAGGGVLLASAGWLKSGRWAGAVWLGAWLCAAYALATRGFMPLDSAARLVWAADELAFVGQGLALLFGLLLGVGCVTPRSRGSVSVERGGFLLFLTAGVMLVTSANDAITLALAWEIVSFVSLALRRIDAGKEVISPQQDAGLWMSMSSSLCLWLGIALGSVVWASTQFDEVRMVLAQAYRPGPGRLAIGAGSKLGLLAMGLMVMGLASRIGLVPWQGACAAQARGVGYWTSGCAMIGGQLAGGLALVRLCGTVWIGFAGELIVLLIVMSVATFFVAGALAARGLMAGEGSLRRWLTAFVLLHGAWLLVGVIASIADLAAPESSLAATPGQPGAISMVLFSMGASLCGLSGLSLLLVHLAREAREVEYVDELLGLGQLAPTTAIALMIVLASLAGVPMTGGFWGRWLLVVSGFQVRGIDGASDVAPHQGVIVLLIVATVASFLLMAVVVRFGRVMFLEEPVSRVMPQGGRAAWVAGGLAALLLLVVGVCPARWLAPLSSRPVMRVITPQEPPAGKERSEATAAADSHDANSC